MMEGPLSKWTNMIHGWQFRWFVLDQHNGLLSYYTSKENMSKGERRGCIRLAQDAYVGYEKEDDITFTITVDDKTFHLQARNLNEREKWVSKIERTIRTHTAANPLAPPPSSSRLFKSSGGGAAAVLGNDAELSSLSEKKWAPPPQPHQHAVSNAQMSSQLSRLLEMDEDVWPLSTDKLDNDLKHFDTSLAETDAYLQLMIEQLKVCLHIYFIS